jgi:hypothetical protein
LKLGEAFPPGLVVEIVDQNIRKGLVVRDFLQEITHPKTKRFILVGLDHDSMTAKLVIINSKIPAFVTGKPHLERLQIPLSPADYSEIIDHDSFVNCMEIISIDFLKLQQRLYGQQAQILGHLSAADTQRLIATLLSAKNISRENKRILSAPLERPR